MSAPKLNRFCKGPLCNHGVGGKAPFCEDCMNRLPPPLASRLRSCRANSRRYGVLTGEGIIALSRTLRLRQRASGEAG